MSTESPKRRLAAILSADAVGYSRLMAEDEATTARTLQAHRAVISAVVSENGGRVVDAVGDNVLAEFSSVATAVTCGMAIQEALAQRNAELPEGRRLPFRIGISVGDVLTDRDNVVGDQVNIAARLEALAEPGGVCISGAVYDQVQGKLPLAFESLGERVVKNIPDPVRVYRVCAVGVRRPAGRARRARRSRLRAVALVVLLLMLAGALAVMLTWPRPLGLVLDLAGLSGRPGDPTLPDRPSLVVLPFTNLSGDPEQEYFSDGITEDLTTELSRHPDLFVISRNSAFTYKGKPVKVEEVGRELGVRYVLEGAVRKAGDRIRVTAQLADATTGFHLWSERYDRELSDVFALQGEIAGDMQAALRVQIDAAEFERLRRHPPENLSAYDLHLKGRFSFNRFTRAGMAEARRFAEQAMALDPGFADNYAMLGGTYVAEYAWGWNLDPRVLERGEALARRALELNARSAWPYVLLANIQVFRGRPAEAAELAQRAIQLEPNRDLAHGVLAAALLQQRRLVGAMQAMQVALRLNPRHPSPVVTALGYLQLAAGRTAEAIRAWERVRSANPDMLLAQLPLAWQYEMQGRHDAARAIVQEIQRVNPQLTATAARQWIRPPIVDDSFVPALQRAGLP